MARIGIAGEGASFVHIQNVGFHDMPTGVMVGGDKWNIEGCLFESVSYAVDDPFGGHHVRVSNNNMALSSSNRIRMELSRGWQIQGNHLAGEIEGIDVEDIVIEGNIFEASSSIAGACITIHGTSSTRVRVVGNHIRDASNDDAITFDTVVDGEIGRNFLDGNNAAGIQIISCTNLNVHNNTINQAGFHGIHLNDSSDCLISENFIHKVAQDDNVYDGIFLEGTSSRNSIWDNKFDPDYAEGEMRYGINVSEATCVDNVVVGNDLGDLAQYASDALNDAGTDTILFYSGDSTYGDNFVPGTTGTGGGGGGSSSVLSAFSSAGVLTTGAGTFKLPFPFAATVLSCKAAVGSAPAGSSIIVDVHKNGTTIFTTQANRPTIAAAATVGANATPDVTTIASGDYLTVDIDQIGSGTPGSDLTVVIAWEAT